MRFLLIVVCVILAAPAQALTQYKIERPNSSNIEFYLERDLGQANQSILLMLHGSGCEPVKSRDWLTTDPEIIVPEAALLVIEKYGVGTDYEEAEKVDSCSRDYWDHATLSRRVADAVQVIAALRSEDWWNGSLIIYGGSEGGAVAAMIVPLVPESKAVIIQSSGIGLSVGRLIETAVPPMVKPLVKRAIANARENPTGNKHALGASYSWWADAADIVAARSLLQTDVPVLLIHGTRDQSAPVSTARAARDLLKKAGKTSFRYVEYEGYDHFMVDADGVDHRPATLHMANKWLNSL